MFMKLSARFQPRPSLFCALLACLTCVTGVLSSVAEPSNETAVIQAQIDAAAAGGGGRVTLARGDHLVGSLLLKSGVELHLSSGARLIGSRDPGDYVLDFSGRGYEERITRRWSNAMIRIIGARDVAVTGDPGSEICGRNCYDPAGEEGFRGPHAITAFGVTNLVLRGYQVRDAGNFGIYASGCEHVRATDVDVRGGHDGFDFFGCRDVLVEGCHIFSGDDCVAGHGNENLTVRDCEVNSACNLFRLGGVNILVEGCRGEGPGRYPHRWSLTEEEKKMEDLPLERGRHNTLGGFTFFASKKRKTTSKNIVIRNCRFSGLMRFVHYNLSGNEHWQQGKGLEDLTFENVTATEVDEPLTAYGVPDLSFRLVLKNCRISFRRPIPRFVAGAHIGLLDLRGTTAERVADGVLMTNWKGDSPRVETEGSSGFPSKVEQATEPFRLKQN